MLMLAAVSQDELPPDVHAVQRVGCKIVQVEQQGDAFRGWWRVYTWAEYAGARERWQRLYSVRDKRAKAFEDCDQWLDAVRKAIARK
jgi:hypothetical protein